jgi:alanine racemase
VLKADAYGHGSKAVGRTLERAGIDGICVALVEEGVELREAGIELPVLVMGGYYGNAFSELVHHRLTPVLSDASQVKRLAQAVGHADDGLRPFPCHVKVDTGMARLGVRPEEVPELLRTLQRHPELRVSGLMSHFANADVDQPGVFDQPLARFDEIRAQFRIFGLVPETLHFANSAALLRDERTHFDLARPGIALFGVDPLADRTSTDDHWASVRLKPTVTVRTKIVSLRTLRQGESTGYGGTFVAPRKSKIATVPMGYADGLSRALSNRGQSLVRAHRAPIVGNVSMDMTTLDVTDIEGVSLGDDVVFLGTQTHVGKRAEILVSEVADWSNTIPWEVLTNISRRVPRFYREA